MRQPPSIEIERAAHAAAVIPELEQLVGQAANADAREVALLRETILNVAVMLPVLTPTIVAFLEATA